MKRPIQGAVLLLAMIAFACAPHFIAPRDAAFTRALGDLTAATNVLFNELQRTIGTLAGAWGNYTTRYAALHAEIAELQAIAGSRPLNELTLRALELLDSNLYDVEDAHRQGISPKEVPVLRDVIAVQLRALKRLEESKPQPIVREVAP